MGREELIAMIRAKEFPRGHFVVFGSGPLAAARIRKTENIDLMVSDKLYSSLKHQGWTEKEGANGHPILEHGRFSATRNWKFGSYHPRLEMLLATAELIHGIPFANLHEVRTWKKHRGRPKDWHDIELIDQHMAKKGWA